MPSVRTVHHLTPSHNHATLTLSRRPSLVSDTRTQTGGGQPHGRRRVRRRRVRSAAAESEDSHTDAPGREGDAEGEECQPAAEGERTVTRTGGRRVSTATRRRVSAAARTGGRRGRASNLDRAAVEIQGSHSEDGLRVAARDPHRARHRRARTAGHGRLIVQRQRRQRREVDPSRLSPGGGGGR